MFDAIFPKHWTTLQRLMWLKTNALARAAYEIVTGNPVTFTAKAAPLRQLKVAFSPVQEGTGDPSPDNVRPISGWNSLTVYHSGADTSNPQTISISLGQTVYSGYVDVISGVGNGNMTKFGTAHVLTQASLGTGSVVHNSGGDATMIRFYHGFGNINRSATLVNCLKYENGAGSWQSMADTDRVSFLIDGAYGAIRLPHFGLETKQDFLDWIENSGIEVCVELTEPVAFQITPQEVSSLLGDNVLFSDANGDLTVTYRSN